VHYFNRSWSLSVGAGRDAGVPRREESLAQPPCPQLVPGRRFVGARHLREYLFPRAAQYRQYFAVRGKWMVVEGFDPPVPPSADLPDGTQDNARQVLPSISRLDRSDEAMPTLGVPQPAFAPLLLAREQRFDEPQLGEQGVSCEFDTVERHPCAPHSDFQNAFARNH
jgi:hypothetical protein